MLSIITRNSTEVFSRNPFFQNTYELSKCLVLLRVISIPIAQFGLHAVVEEDRSCSITAAVGSSMYISNTLEGQREGHAVDGPRCGSRTNPWTVEVQSGQIISVSVMDFGQQQQQQQQRPTDDVTKNHVDKDGLQQDICDVPYGFILDKSVNAQTNRNMTICSSSGLQRDRFVYQSKGSRIEVVLSLAGTDLGKFLLGFEGNEFVSLDRAGMFLVCFEQGIVINNIIKPLT